MENFFAKNIKYLRKKKNIDQNVMAEDLGVAQSTLSCWENGLRTPDLDMIAKISKYLNVYDDFISKDLTGIEESPPTSNIDRLYSKTKDILNDDERAMIEFTMQRAIDRYEEQKNNEK